MQHMVWCLLIATCQVVVQCALLPIRGAHLSQKASDHPDEASKLVAAKRAERSRFQLKGAETVVRSSCFLRNGSATLRMNSSGLVDLKCIRKTGGSCAMSGCKAERGPTECVQNFCVCPVGFCAAAEGTCQKGQGELIGKFSIRFPNPGARSDQPYMGTSWSTYFKSQVLDMVADAAPQWLVFLSHDGFVRFESTKAPGMVLSTSLLSDSKGLKLIDRSSIGSPGSVNFQVNQVLAMMEIWSPAAKKNGAISSWDHKSGVLAPRMTVSLCKIGCAGREFVQFEPALPNRAVSYLGRALVTPVGNLWWQSLLSLAVVVLLCVGCYCGSSDARGRNNSTGDICDCCIGCNIICSCCF